MPDERELEQRHAPESALPLRPIAEACDLTRVVAEAVARQHAVQHREIALQARRSLADDLRRTERKLVSPEHELVELVELVLPVAGAPFADVAGIRRAEMAVEMRPDLVPFAVRAANVGQRPAHDVDRQCKADVGAARTVPRGPVDRAVRPVEEVHAADEEREVRADFARDRPPVRPELRAAGAVEGDDDELRRSSRRARGRREVLPRRLLDGAEAGDGNRAGDARKPDGERSHESPPAACSPLRCASAQPILHSSILGWGSSGLVERRFLPITTSWAN